MIKKLNNVVISNLNTVTFFIKEKINYLIFKKKIKFPFK